MTTVVKDAAQTLAKANEISKKLLQVIIEEIKVSQLEDDPAEQIYLAIHTLAAFSHTMFIIIDGFGKIYDIPNLTMNEIRKWVLKLLDEYSELHSKK